MAITAPNRRDTDASKTMAGQPAAVETDKALLPGETRERLPSGYDEFSISAEERKELNFSDTEDHVWVRNPRIWMQDEKSDRVREVKRRYPGSRVVIDPATNEPVCQGDLLLMAMPKAHGELRQAEIQTAYEERWANYDENEETIRDGYDPEKVDLRSLRTQAHRNAISAGWAGEASPTSGMPYRTAVSLRNKDEIAQEEARYRGGGRHVDVSDQLARERQERDQARKSQYFGTGNNPIGPQTREQRTQVFSQAREQGQTRGARR